MTIDNNNVIKCTFIVTDNYDLHNLHIGNCYNLGSGNIQPIQKIIHQDSTMPVPDSFKIIKEKEIIKEYDPIDSLEL